MRKSTIVMTVLVALASAACSDDGTAQTDTGGSPAGTEGCDSPVETASIQIADLAFDPSCILLPSGTATLSVQNTDDTDHTFTISEVDLNEPIDPGEDVGVDVAALTGGVYAFRCSIHPQMTGSLTV